MNKEVKETIKILQNNSLVKSGSYEFIGDSDITYAEIYILLKFIEDLQQENQQLRIQISAREEVYRKLEDNWNKLKEYIDKTKFKEFEKSYGKRYGKTFTQAEIIVCNMIKDKMKEIERSDSNVKD